MITTCVLFIFVTASEWGNISYIIYARRLFILICIIYFFHLIFYFIYPEIASKRTPMSALLSQAMGLFTHNGDNGEPAPPTKSMFKSQYKCAFLKGSDSLTYQWQTQIEQNLKKSSEIKNSKNSGHFLYKKDTALQKMIEQFLKQNYEPEYLPESKLVLY